MTLSEIYRACEDYLGRDLYDDEKDYLYIKKITSGWGFQQLHVSPITHQKANLIGDSGERNRLMVSLGMPDGTQGKVVLGHTYREAAYTDGILGDIRYVAKVGNPIDWQAMHEIDANHHIGILFIPEHKDKDGKNYCAQFVGSKKYRVWMRLDQAEKCIRKLVAGFSLLRAVEMSLDIPLTPIEKDLIAKVMRN